MMRRAVDTHPGSCRASLVWLKGPLCGEVVGSRGRPAVFSTERPGDPTGAPGCPREGCPSLTGGLSRPLAGWPGTSLSSCVLPLAEASGAPSGAVGSSLQLGRQPLSELSSGPWRAVDAHPGSCGHPLREPASPSGSRSSEAVPERDGAAFAQHHHAAHCLDCSSSKMTIFARVLHDRSPRRLPGESGGAVSMSQGNATDTDGVRAYWDGHQPRPRRMTSE